MPRPCGLRLAATLVSAAVILACHRTPVPDATATAVRVQDSRGKSVGLARPAARIVCLIESALSGLYMLGAEAQVVGVPADVLNGSTARYYAAMDPRLRQGTLPAPGNWDFVSVESVLALRPDLVIVWASQTETIAAIENLGLPVYAVFLGSFEDVFEEVLDLGTLTGRRERARDLVNQTRSRLEALSARLTAASGGQPRAFFMWAGSGLETSGRASTVNDLIQRAGCRNVAGEIASEHATVGMEQVLAFDPDLVVLWDDPRRDPADLLADRRWSRIRAIRDQRVFELPEVFWCDLWTLKLAHAVNLVAHWGHPSVISAAMVEREKEQMLAFLYQGKLKYSEHP